LVSATNVGAINPFGIAALAGLVGMFSKQATDKLAEIFKALFRTAPGQGDDTRKDKLNNPVPRITRVRLNKSEGDLLLAVEGGPFVKGSIVRVNSLDRETKFVSETQITALLSSSDVGTISVMVFTPPPGGGTSNEVRVDT
jgi:hypothetical protein